MSEKTPEALDVWRKSSACDNSSGNCAEVMERSDKTWAVRNSRQPGLAITYDSDEWAAFIGAAKAGEFDA